MKSTKSGFQTNQNKGFHITFENGWTVSVQFGRGNYSDNYDWQGAGYEGPVENEQAPKSRTAEVAIWPNGGEMSELPCGQTCGNRYSPEQVLALLNETAARTEEQSQ